MNFGELKQLVTSSLGREPSASVYQLVTADLNATLRVADMIKDVTIPVSADSSGAALPDDYLAALSFSWEADGTEYALSMAPMVTVLARRTRPGIPEIVGIKGKRAELAPVPVGDGNLVLSYYAALPDLAADDETNFVLDTFPNVYVYGAMMHHGRIIGDPMADGWQAQYAAQIALVKAADKAGVSGAGPFKVVPAGPIV